MIKAYSKSVDKESSNSRTKSSSSRTTIGTRVNTNIRAVKAHQFVNYAATTASTTDEATASTAGSGNAGSSTAAATAANADEHFVDDVFAEEPASMSPLIQRSLVRDWKAEAVYQPKLHLQDLMFYNIADFTSSNSKDGTHYVYGNKLAFEKSLHKVEYKPKREIAQYARELLKSSSQLATLKERLKSNKHKASHDDNCYSVLKICKAYVKLHDDEIYLYNADVNENTYLMCYIRPLLIHLLRPLDLYQFQWAEAVMSKYDMK